MQRTVASMIFRRVGTQLDVGAQFMDFRYVVHDRWHGEFYLDHCGALLDVEQMGEDYVRGMCHDIEDPTFDATTVATNARVQIRPIHRPPRIPADRHPVCARTVVIDDSHPEVTGLPSLAVIEKIRALIDESDDGLADSGPLLSDFDFTAYSQSALVRMADEVRLQMHLLNLSFVLAVQRRAIDDDQDRGIAPNSSSGWSGLPPNAFTRPSQPASRPGWCAADDGIASNVQSEGIHRRQVRGRADSVATAAPPTTTEHGLRCVTPDP